MKKYLILLLTLFACQSDLTEMEIPVSTLETVLNKKQPKELYKNLTIPKEYTDPLLNDRDQLSNEEFAKIKENIQNWLNEKTTNLEKECKKTDDCDEKKVLMDKLFYIQSQVDHLGLGNVELVTSLCGGYYDETNVYIDILPGDLNLELYESQQLSSEVIVGDQSCTTGEVGWYSDNPSIASVDENNGLVTALSYGSTYITAVLLGTRHITGTIRVEVNEPDAELYEIVFVVDASPENIPGIFETGGFIESSNAITNALSNNFGTNFKFGLVGFDHHAISPFGNSFDVCISEGWPEVYSQWTPLLPQSPFDKWLDFTSNESSIQAAIENIQMMCSVCLPPSCMSSASYTAIIETINNFNWSQNSNKVIIIFSTKPIKHLKFGTNEPNNGSEGVSGLHAQEVIELANQNQIKLFTISGGAFNTTFGEWLDHEFQFLADGTNGLFINRYDTWPNPSLALINAINQIESKF